MITILHGEDIQASRNYLTNLKIKSKNFKTFYKETFDFSQVVQAIDGNTLFEKSKSFFFEGFLDKKIDPVLLDFIHTHSQINDFVLWEGKKLSAPLLSPFKKAEIRIFTFPQTLFSFVDSLGPKNFKNSIREFHDALKHTEAELLFYMLVRQFRLMIAVVDEKRDTIDEIVRLTPWQKTKIKKQSELFGQPLLLKLYKKLSNLDFHQKTGILATSLVGNIDFFLLSF